ncbi:hypothetical protein DM02DRAFT_627236 [Periconia macrospinosa]|uniref:Uncharacterized protein n=1 Tax=Periconia macrospinosa TaxID=97972 RepID=A0A2V1DUY7_9PLEO|nr:hypothetical protein DM02DRAFT_627236 [Periconia macrospinosa]
MTSQHPNTDISRAVRDHDGLSGETSAYNATRERNFNAYIPRAVRDHDGLSGETSAYNATRERRERNSNPATTTTPTPRTGQDQSAGPIQVSHTIVQVREVDPIDETVPVTEPEGTQRIEQPKKRAERMEYEEPASTRQVKQQPKKRVERMEYADSRRPSRTRGRNNGGTECLEGCGCCCRCE